MKLTIRTELPRLMLMGRHSKREGVKKVFNAMLHARKPLKKLPKGTRPLLGNRIKVGEVTDLIKSFHAPIADAFYAGRGLHFTFIESDILLTVLEELMAKEITALPIHDAVVIREDHEVIATEVMLRVFKDKTGTDGLVAKEG